MRYNFLECKLLSLFRSTREALEHVSPMVGLSIRVQAARGGGTSRSLSFPMPKYIYIGTPGSLGMHKIVIH